MGFSKIRTLLFFAQYTDKLSYYDDWKEAFLAAGGFDTDSLDIFGRANIRQLARRIKDYDLIVLLHSTNADTLHYINPYKNILNQRRGKLIVFVGNEYNSPIPGAGVKDKIIFLQETCPEYIATQLPLETGQKLYEDLKDSEVVSMPHALNPERFYPSVPQSERGIDIGVRSHRYSPLIGDNERNAIVDYFIGNKFNPPLKIDIGTDAAQRFNKDDWPVFLNSCKGTVATEAGSYFLEKDDATVLKIAEYVRNKGSIAQRSYMKLDIGRYSRFIPDFIKPYLIIFLRNAGIKSHDPNAIYYSVSFDKIYEIFFKNYVNPLNGKCISSRHFDTIGTKTCQLMFKGGFNKILEADKHYICLERDFSNIEEAIKRFNDDYYRNKMIDETYDYIMNAHTYKHRMYEIEGLIRSSQGTS